MDVDDGRTTREGDSPHVAKPSTQLGRRALLNIRKSASANLTSISRYRTPLRPRWRRGRTRLYRALCCTLLVARRYRMRDLHRGRHVSMLPTTTTTTCNFILFCFFLRVCAYFFCFVVLIFYFSLLYCLLPIGF